jgi:hypothetical protein
MNWKGFLMKWPLPNPGAVLSFGWRNEGKPQNTSVRKADVLAEI